MSILISGDFHANSCQELSIITKKALVKKYTQAKYEKIKYHIILGDAGFLWPGNLKTDEFNFKTLACRPFPVLCVIGNHEPILGMMNDPDLPEADIGIGEKVWVVKREKPFVAYLKRGRIYTIDKHKFLVLGGALSIDKDMRIPGRSWWANEYWSEEEKDALFKMLKNENEFDYVITHTGPSRINQLIFNSGVNRAHYIPKFHDEVAALNENIDGIINCKQWFCGHWHKDVYFFDDNMERGYQYLYNQTALLEGKKVRVG